MISAVRTNKAPTGFTLIEIVMVLAIAAIVMGGAVGMMVYSSDERTLRNTSGDVELLAKRARTTAILNQTPYALEFREGVVRLLPLANAGLDRRKISKNLVEPDSEDVVLDSSRQIHLENGVKVFVRRWNSAEWLSTLKEVVHVWRFDPDGLCEPITLRFTLDKSWVEDTYHPLTATISESSLEAR
jgi:prepilin-type N-terminal cleavage/methylation domain-containing protein